MPRRSSGSLPRGGSCRPVLCCCHSSLWPLPRRLSQSGAIGGVQYQASSRVAFPGRPPAACLQEIPMMKIVAEMMIMANAAVGRRIAAAFPRAALLRRHPPPRREAFGEARGEVALHQIACMRRWHPLRGVPGGARTATGGWLCCACCASALAPPLPRPYASPPPPSPPSLAGGGPVPGAGRTAGLLRPRRAVGQPGGCRGRGAPRPGLAHQVAGHPGHERGRVLLHG